MHQHGDVILGAWIAAAAVMLVLWLVQLRTRVAGIVDVAWAVVTAALATGLAATAGDGDPLRRLLLCAMIGLWGLRLAAHLATRLRSEKEDGRYVAMKRALGRRRVQPAMFLFFQIQALWAVIFALPVAAAALARRGGLDVLDAAGAFLWLLALGGEWLADSQLAQFKSNPLHQGLVCREGLWRYSRHPNYFFEWIHWFAYVLIGWGSPWWGVTLAGLALMYLFLNFLTGIPFAEQQALRSRGKAYRDYQSVTSRFFPLPPKTEEERQ